VLASSVVAILFASLIIVKHAAEVWAPGGWVSGLRELVWDFARPGAELGWAPGHSVSDLTVKEGVLCFSITGFDPWIYSPRIDVPAEELYVIEVEVAASKGEALKLYWITDRSPNWGEDKAALLPIEADGRFHTYELDLRAYRGWSGRVLQLRLDLEPPDAVGAVVCLHRVVLRAKPAELEVVYAGPDCSLVVSGKLFSMIVRLRNTGGVAFNGVSVTALAPSGPVSSTLREPLPPLGQLEARVSGLVLEGEGVFTVPIVVEASGVRVAKNVTLLAVRSERLERSVASLEGGGVALGFVGREGAVAGLIVYGREGGELRRLAVVSPLSRVVYVDRAGVVREDLVIPRVELRSGDAVRLRYASGLYEVELTFRLRPPDKVEVGYRLAARDRLELLRFDGPWLHVGEGSFGSRKAQALLPGLEWLEGDESSSSTLDVHEPHHLRLSPAAYKITTPAMGIEAEGFLVGLLWEQREWGPRAVFCSPNWFEGQSNHLMGLFLPGDGYVRENELVARTPYTLEGGNELEIRAVILVRRGGSVLDLVPEWIELFGSLDAEPPRDPQGIIALCREGFANLWDPGRSGWRHATPGWEPEPHPAFAFLLLLDHMITGSEEALRMAEAAVRCLLSSEGVEALSGIGGSHIHEPQLPFLVGYLPDSLGAFGSLARALAASQRPDGSWAYAPEMSIGRAELGRAGETSVGICA